MHWLVVTRRRRYRRNDRNERRTLEDPQRRPLNAITHAHRYTCVSLRAGLWESPIADSVMTIPSLLSLRPPNSLEAAVHSWCLENSTHNTLKRANRVPLIRSPHKRHHKGLLQMLHEHLASVLRANRWRQRQPQLLHHRNRALGRNDSIGGKEAVVGVFGAEAFDDSSAKNISDDGRCDFVVVDESVKVSLYRGRHCQKKD